MTDMTSQTVAEETEVAHRRRANRTEFMVYFTIIFLATLPLATLTWALAAIKARSLWGRGPVARAWSQARIITPQIFRA